MILKVNCIFSKPGPKLERSLRASKFRGVLSYTCLAYRDDCLEVLLRILYTSAFISNIFVVSLTYYEFFP